jgi:LysM repeat protein
MKKLPAAGLLGLALILAACGQPPAETQSITPRPSVAGIQLKSTEPAPGSEGPTSAPFDTPTPDPTRVVDDAGTELYIVQDGDTFSAIASEFGTTPEEIAQTNGLTTLSMIHPGDPLNVPLKLDRVGPGIKLIPDSELVYSPGTIDFDSAAFIDDRANGYLKAYTEEVDGER